MLATPLITASIETVLNRLIQDDPGLVRQLARLKGKVVQLQVKDVAQTFTFIFSQQVDVLADYAGEPDCYLSLSLAILPQLKEQPNITQLIKQDRLVLEGDMQLAQQFAQLLTDSRPDIEEWLSRLTGDVVAHSVVSGIKSCSHSLQSSFEKHQSHLAQIITEEWKLAPGPLEVAHFCDQVEELSEQLSRVEARFNVLAEKL